mgnify:CR=1 FL=1
MNPVISDLLDDDIKQGILITIYWQFTNNVDQ